MTNTEWNMKTCEDCLYGTGDLSWFCDYFKKYQADCYDKKCKGVYKLTKTMARDYHKFALEAKNL